ncbi:MAG: tetratricopeptide repeat protein [Thermoanaerobaculia bacterium]
MKLVSLVLALSMVAAPVWWNGTNSDAATRRGIALYGQKRYAEAVKAFEEAYRLRPSSRTAFDLGTAKAAAGDLDGARELLGKALKDPELRTGSLYNQGNAALDSKKWDEAIRKYEEALRSDPRNPAAKRNLEIARLRRKEEQKKRQQQRQQQKQKEGQQNPKQGSGHQQRENPQNGPSEAHETQRPGEADPMALLRAAEQQEKQELERMHKQSMESRGVDW